MRLVEGLSSEEDRAVDLGFEGLTEGPVAGLEVGLEMVRDTPR